MLFAILVFFTQVCVAQAYKYISMEDGLGSQKVYRILQDSLGYMWFLTQEGPDRYNGKEIKHYELTDKGQKLNMQFSLNWLYMADDGVCCGELDGKAAFSAMSRAGIGFEQVYMPPLPEKGISSPNITYSYMDHSRRIWLCSKEQMALFDTRTGKISQLSSCIISNVTSIAQIDRENFFIGTESGLYRAVLDESRTLLS